MENDNDLVVSKKQNKIKGFINKIFGSKRNKIIFIVTLSIIFIVGGTIGYKHYTNKKYEEKHKQYEVAFTQTTVDILKETILCGTMTQTVSQTWHDAIFSNSYIKKDFNVAIQELNQKFEDDGTLKERKDNKEKIEKEMIKLQNPPSDYTDAYKLFVDLYSKYGQIYSQAISPAGSLTSYNNDTTTKLSEFNEIYDKIVVLKPEIKLKK